MNRELRNLRRGESGNAMLETARGKGEIEKRCCEDLAWRRDVYAKEKADQKRGRVNLANGDAHKQLVVFNPGCAQGGLSEKERRRVEAQAARIAAEELYDHGDHDKAIEQWREALRLDPGLIRAHQSLGMALRGEGQLPEAIAELQEAARLDPRNAEVQADLGDTLQKQGDLDAALAAYRASLTLVPNSAPVHNNLGYVLARKDDLDGAIAAWREAIRIDSKYPAPYVNLGEALETKGDTEGAIAAYERFLGLAPKAPTDAAVRKQVESLKVGKNS